METMCCFSGAVLSLATTLTQTGRLQSLIGAPLVAKRRERVGEQGRRRAKQALEVPIYRTGSISQDYQFGKELGKGGFGVVREATSLASGAQVAVKLIKASRLSRHARFRNEIALAASMRHPNIVKVHAVYMDASGAHLVMELCSGGELFDRIITTLHGVTEERLAALWVRQMVSALVYIHSRSIVHRDIKPDNFVFDGAGDDECLKLTDFGCACQRRAGSTLSTIVGTPAYMAPEVSARCYDERVDVWSTGVVTYVLLCGRVPVRAECRRAVRRSIHQDHGALSFTEDPWPKRTDAAIEVTKGLLTYNFRERPSAREVLFHPWLCQSSGVAHRGDDAVVLSSCRSACCERPLTCLVAPDTPANSKEDSEKRGEEGNVDTLKSSIWSMEQSLLGQPVVVENAVPAFDAVESWEDLRALGEFRATLAPPCKQILVGDFAKQEFQHCDAEPNASTLAAAEVLGMNAREFKLLQWQAALVVEGIGCFPDNAGEAIRCLSSATSSTCSQTPQAKPAIRLGDLAETSANDLDDEVAIDACGVRLCCADFRGILGRDIQSSLLLRQV